MPARPEAEVEEDEAGEEAEALITEVATVKEVESSLLSS